jgi:hypothetical protein
MQMQNQIQSIAIEKLIAHPDNPNVMSKAKLNKLVRHLEQTGRYEPIIVRPQNDCFQIINGHYRVEALKKLGSTNADCLIWDLDDKEADMYLLTLNRLGGRDVLDKKITLLRRLTNRPEHKERREEIIENNSANTAFSAVNDETEVFRELGKLLPQTAKQIERLRHLKLPSVPDVQSKTCTEQDRSVSFMNPVVFFVSNRQQDIIRRAISLAQANTRGEAQVMNGEKSKARQNADAMTKIAEQFEGYSRRAQQTIDEKCL